jgi:hypothetical protein
VTFATSVGVRVNTSSVVVVGGLKVELELADCESVVTTPAGVSDTVELSSSLEMTVDGDWISVVFSTSIGVGDVDASDILVRDSVDVDTDDDVTSTGTSDDSVVEVSSFLVVDASVSSEIPVLEVKGVDVGIEISPAVVEVNSPDTVDWVVLSKLVLELLATSPGNVEVDSDSAFSVDVTVASEVFVVDGVVGRVISGGQGLSFVVLLIVGRVGGIDDSDDELSELVENSVEVERDVSEVSETLVDADVTS